MEEKLLEQLREFSRLNEMHKYFDMRRSLNYLLESSKFRIFNFKKEEVRLSGNDLADFYAWKLEKQQQVVAPLIKNYNKIRKDKE